MPLAFSAPGMSPPTMQQNVPLLASGLLLLIFCWNSSLTVAQEISPPTLDPTKALTEYVHVFWDTEDGLPQSSINAIEQTEDGYIWLGTQEGLVRFDGMRFTEFNTRNVAAFESNDIRVLKRSRHGGLWIGTRNTGLYRYTNGLFSRVSPENSLNNASITAIIESDQGHLWIGTAESGLKQLVNGKLIAIDIPTHTVSALVETAPGTLWIGSRDAGLIRYDKGKVAVFSNNIGLMDNDVTSLASSKDGGLWVGTREGGLVHLHNDTLYVATVEHGLPSNRILTLFEDPTGSLWIGTDQAGVSRLRLDVESPGTDIDTRFRSNTLNPIHSAWEEPLQFSSFASSDGLTYDVVKSFLFDREGNLLIGTDGGGLNMLREGKFTMYTETMGLPDNFVYAIHEDLYGTMWFSTEKGVGRLSKGTLSAYSTADGLASNVAISIASTPDSSVWIGTYEGGLSRFHKGSFTTYTHKDGLPENSIYGLYSDSKGHLWVGTGKGVARMREDRFTTFTTDEGLSSDMVTVILESQDESIWIGTYSAGLNKLHNDQFIPFASANELAETGVLALHEDNDGVLWIGTYEEGLIRLRDGILTTYTSADGLFNDTILHILEDERGYLWMSSNQGLFRIHKKQLDEFAAGVIDAVTSEVFGKGDGLKTNEFNGGVQTAGWKSQDGKIWFPSKQGVAAIDPERIRKNVTPPLIEVEDVLIDGKALSIEESIELPPNMDRIAIRYAGITLVSPEKVRYQYQLIGEDNTWVDAGNGRTAYYTNLDPGDYEFKVRAQNSDGIWSQNAASFSFYREPYMHQTLWFRLTCICFFAMMILGWVRWRMAELRSQKQVLEQMVNERTLNLQERTSELLKALDENNEILSITSHDLKNPLSGIVGLSELLLKDLSKMQPNPALEEGLENVQLMRDEAERMLRIVIELLDKHQAAEEAYLHSNAFDLVHLVSDIIQRHQRSAENKNIEIIFDMDDSLFVEFNEDVMLRIVDNLISNAIKFSPTGKRVWMSLAIQEVDITFTVRDEGPGLTEEDIKKVFGKSQRLSAQPTAGEQSNGLGLFIVKQLADEYGITVGVHSVRGEGASFWVKLPVSVALLAS